MFSAISPTNLSAWLITMDGVGYGVIGLAPTLEDAISQGLLLSADPVGQGDTIRITGPDGLAALIVDGAVFVRKETTHAE